MRRAILALLCAGAILLAAGCGSSGSGGGSSTSGGNGGGQLSEPAFRAKANHICSQLSRQEQPDVHSTAKSALDRNLARIDSALGQLQTVQPPAKDRTRYRQLLKSFGDADAYVKRHESTLVRLANLMKRHPNDVHTSAQYQTLVRPFLLAAQVAASDAQVLGLGACAKGFTGGSSR